jgi:hypothetical protein
MANPPLTTTSEVASHDQEHVTVGGTYTVQDLGGHSIRIEDGDGGWRTVKRIALVRLDDGGFVELVDRPDEEMDTLDGQRVVADGLLFHPAAAEDEAMAASDPLPTLTSVSRVEVA